MSEEQDALSYIAQAIVWPDKIRVGIAKLEQMHSRLAAAEAARDVALAKLAKWKVWADQVEPWIPNDSSVPEELPRRPDAEGWR